MKPKAIIKRMIEYQPASPHAKCKTLDVENIMDFQTIRDPLSLHDGHLRIRLVHGSSRYALATEEEFRAAFEETEIPDCDQCVHKWGYFPHTWEWK